MNLKISSAATVLAISVAIAAPVALLSVASYCIGAGDFGQTRYYTRKLMRLTWLCTSVVSAATVLAISVAIAAPATPIRKIKIRMAFPTRLIRFIKSDTVMISGVGEAAVSGVSLVDNINILVINIFAAMATGGAVVAGHALGQKNQEQAGRSAWQMMLFLLYSSVAMTVLLLGAHRVIAPRYPLNDYEPILCPFYDNVKGFRVSFTPAFFNTYAGADIFLRASSWKAC